MRLESVGDIVSEKNRKAQKEENLTNDVNISKMR